MSDTGNYPQAIAENRHSDQLVLRDLAEQLVVSSLRNKVEGQGEYTSSDLSRGIKCESAYAAEKWKETVTGMPE